MKKISVMFTKYYYVQVVGIKSLRHALTFNFHES